MDFTPINNERLRKLVMESASIGRLPDEEKAALIQKIALLPPEGQSEMIAALEKSQKAIKAAETLKVQQEKDLDGEYQKLVSIQRNLENGIRLERQKSVQNEDVLFAENLINTI